jgi:type IV pilus assembly protein PilE
MTAARFQRGFTLIELMITVMIVAILAVIAVPAYNSQAMKARRSDGQSYLLTIQSRMERYMYDHDTYPSDLSQMSFSATSPEQHYEVEIVTPTAACPISICYQLLATPRGGQTADGPLELHSNGQKVGHWD